MPKCQNSSSMPSSSFIGTAGTGVAKVSTAQYNDVIEPLLTVRNGAGVDDHRFCTPDDEGVEVDEQWMAERGLDRLDQPGVGRNLERRLHDLWRERCVGHRASCPLNSIRSQPRTE